VPDLVSKGVVTGWDMPLLGVFVDAVARQREAAEVVAREGVLVRGEKGRTVKHPAAQVSRDHASTMTSLAGRFGLTPSDRAQLSLPAAPSSSAGRDQARLLS
jgi:P27 family predicted phage terminase small subunit